MKLDASWEKQSMTKRPTEVIDTAMERVISPWDGAAEEHVLYHQLH